MLEPKAQLFLNYKKEQFRYFLIACNNSINNDETLKIQMIAEAIEETKTLRIIFQCFTYENLAMFMTFNDFSIENDEENKFLYEYILEKCEEKSKFYRSFENKKRISAEFVLKHFDNNLLSHCSFLLNFYEEGETFEIEGNDIYISVNLLSLKGSSTHYPFKVYTMCETYRLFDTEESDEVFLKFPYSKILTSALLGNYTFRIYDILKRLQDNDCTLVFNPSNKKSKDKVKIIKNKENILESEPYNMSIDTYFIREEFKYREFYGTINLKFLEPFKNYAEDFDMYASYNFLIPTTPSHLPIVHRYCGGFYIFVQDTRVQIITKIEEVL